MRRSILCVFLLAGCVVEQDIDVQIVAGATIPGAVTQSLVIYRDRCPGRVDLAALDLGSLPEIAHEQQYRPGEARPIGVLPEGSYCVTMLLRNESDCRPVAYGESLVDLADTSSVRVSLQLLTWMGQTCPDQVGCAEGFCAGSAPPCDVGSCTGICCGDGTCVEDAATCDSCGGACEGDLECIDGRCREPSTCGAPGLDECPPGCAQPCPPSLSCTGTLCTAAPPAEVQIVLDGSMTIPTDRTDLRFALAWFSSDAFFGDLQGPVRAEAAVSIGEGGDMTYLLPSDPDLVLASESPLGLAVGVFVLFQDTTGNEMLDESEFLTPNELGIGDLVVLLAERDLDGAALGDLLPYGAAQGLHLYEGSAEGTLIPTTTNEVHLSPCFGGGDGSMADAACLMAELEKIRLQ